MANLGWCKVQNREHKLSDFTSRQMHGPVNAHKEVCRYCGKTP